MRDFAESFYKSKAWQACRQSYGDSKHWLCESCRERGLFTPGVIVHHKIHLTPENIHEPEITMGWNNLQLLCRDCHGAIHKPQKRYYVDDLGRVTARG